MAAKLSERKLRRWRKEALQFKENIEGMDETTPTVMLCDRILEMTQELLDDYLKQK